MKKLLFFILIGISLSTFITAQDFKITDTYVLQNAELDQLIFTIEVAGIAGDSVPQAIGSLDGAPILAYAFPTDLSPTDVGFEETSGIVTLALTAHPDFDDTPLWDENNDAIYDNDGLVWHSHWVVLEENTAVPAGLAAKATNNTSILPPTNPGMPLYFDSPGYPVVWKGNKISCTIPLFRIRHKKDFHYDAVTALLYVNTSKPDLPLLGIYEIFDIASQDLSLPYSVGNYSCDTLFIDISGTTGIGLIDPRLVKVYPNPASTLVHIEMSPDFDLSSYDLEIFDAAGSLSYQSQINDLDLLIPIEDIGNSGIYFLRIVDRSSGVILGSKKLVLF